MTDYTINSPSVGNPIAELAQSLLRRAKEKRMRRTLAELLALEDAQLDDIGVTRPDIEAARSLPMSVDVATTLHISAHLHRGPM